MVQVALFVDACTCGSPVVKAGRCARCYANEWHDHRHFGGHRQEVIERDGHQCRACQGREQLIVHHRLSVSDPAWMITLCAGCHARVHRTFFIRYWMPALLVQLWEEQHPGVPVQLQIEA